MFKNIKKRYIFVLILIFFMTLVAITSKLTNEDRNLTFFEKAIKDTGNFIEKIFNVPIVQIFLAIQRTKSTTSKDNIKT